EHLVDHSSWTTVGRENGREQHYITSLHLLSEKMEEINIHLQDKYKLIQKNETRYEEIQIEDADILIVAFGLSSRSSQKALELAREQGFKVGMLRPITLFPFPSDELNRLAEQVKGILVVEMNAGQMVEDVRLSVNKNIPIEFYGRMGGMIPQPDEIVQKIKDLSKQVKI
ncbi:MAG: 3-methyl-2-oxobutanoate dehydrogenase subunit beta, partial [Candidatus Marinimicrobia bacterium]|nr:3-methyl-2-oxobutanoate dehydrogenase subunit beta [Candidatus Neomarinimicrobiota bacterium]